jgi:membrane dipeptidase
MSHDITRREFTRDLVAAAAVTSTRGRPLPGQESMLIVNGLDPSSLSVEYLDLLKRGGVGAWLRAEHQTLEDFAASHAFYDQHASRIVAVRTVREIREAHRQGKVAQILGWQSAEQLTVDSNQAALAGPVLTNLRGYYELGLRTCGIAYNLTNQFGAGCLEPHIGLTRNGRKLVEEIHRLRMVLDVGGHTGEQTSLDALAMASGVPVICSHTNIKTLNDNPRCTSDRVLEAIAKTGGVIGLTAFNDFHARTRNDAGVLRTAQVGLEKHLDQYDYLKKLVGVDHIGLGPDFTFGGTKPIPEPPRSASETAGRVAERNPNGSAQFAGPEAYSVQTPWLYVNGFENIGELPNVIRGLESRGWSAAELRQVLGENWLRVYERVWGR